MICIPLTQGKHAVIDNDDWELVSKFKWHTMRERGGKLYASTTVGPAKRQKHLFLHRLIMGVRDGKFLVDHVDGDPLNNTRSNLRICTHAQNMRNAVKSKRNTSGYKGVSLIKASGRWQATIQYLYKSINLGTFETAEAAHVAYCDAANKLHGEFRNFG